MHPGHHVHVPADGVVLGGRSGDLFAGAVVAADCLEVQPDIQVRVELRAGPATRDGQHRIRVEGALEHLVDLAHGRAAVWANRQERGLGPLWCLGSGDAEEMPGGILDVVGIDRAVRLELLAAVVVAADVVQHDPALP